MDIIPWQEQFHHQKTKDASSFHEKTNTPRMHQSCIDGHILS